MIRILHYDWLIRLEEIILNITSWMNSIISFFRLFIAYWFYFSRIILYVNALNCTEGVPW